MSQPYAPYAQPLRAPEGTNPSTVHFWIIIAIYGLQCIPAYVYLFTFDISEYFAVALTPSDPLAVYGLLFTPAYIALLATSFLAYGATALFAYFDMKALAQRGVPSPFHWALSLIPSYGSMVYVIGRVVIVYRRTRGGLAPLWVFIGLTVLSFIVSIVGSFAMMNSMMSQLPGLVP